LPEEPNPWTITISEFNGFAPAWFKSTYPFFGDKDHASDMKNIDLTDPNSMTQGPAPTALTAGTEAGAVTTTVKSFLRHVTSDDVSFALGGAKLYQISSTAVTNAGVFPHTIDKATVTGEDGEGLCYHKTKLYYFYNHSGSAGDIGQYDMATTFDDDWGSTVPTGFAALQTGPHQAINGGDDEVYFTNGRYMGAIRTSGILEPQALDFWTDAQTSSVTWNQNRVIVAVNRPNVTGSNMNQSGVYTWNGVAGSWEGDPIEVNGRIGALYTKNGVTFVWWQDAGTSSEFNLGYLVGTQIKGLKKCEGTLPLYYQVGEFKGYLAWISDGLVYLYGSSDPDTPIKFFQYTSSTYTTTVGGIGFALGSLMTASHNASTGYNIAKASNYTVDSSWKTRAFDVYQPGVVSYIDKIQVVTEQMSTGARVDCVLTYDQGKSTSTLSNIAYSASNYIFHKILDKSYKLQDFRLDFDFANGSTTNPVKIRSILIKGHFVPEI
jgi:hypothetical protein